MLVLLCLCCFYQTLFASQLDESHVIQDLTERISLLELSIGQQQLDTSQQQLGTNNINDPLPNLPERNGVRPARYQNLESKIRKLEGKMLNHEELIIQLKNSKDRIDTLERSVDTLAMVATEQIKEIDRVKQLEIKVAEQERVIVDLRKQTFDCEHKLFDFQNQLNIFQHSKKSEEKVGDPIDTIREDVEGDKEEERSSVRTVHTEKRQVHLLQSKHNNTFFYVRNCYRIITKN
jgi:uncharacterized coiled-coil protein SlyX